jgi:hypothetical protein
MSNSKLPHYNPEHDANLKYFFDKPSNKKILEKLKEQKLARKSQYVHDAISEHKTSSINLNPINQTRLMKHKLNPDLLGKKKT